MNQQRKIEFTKLAPVLNVRDLASERRQQTLTAVCDDHRLDYVVDVQRPRHDWVYRRLLLTSPNGYRVALEGPTEG